MVVLTGGVWAQEWVQHVHGANRLRGLNSNQGSVIRYTGARSDGNSGEEDEPDDVAQVDTASASVAKGTWGSALCTAVPECGTPFGSEGVNSMSGKNAGTVTLRFVARQKGQELDIVPDQDVVATVHRGAGGKANQRKKCRRNSNSGYSSGQAGGTGGGGDSDNDETAYTNTTCTGEFVRLRVLNIFWGVKPLAHFLAQGSTARAAVQKGQRGSGQTMGYAICQMV